MEDYRVKLIEIARELAGGVSAGNDAGGTMVNPMMGMDPFMRTPDQVTELLDRTDANLRELGG